MKVFKILEKDVHDHFIVIGVFALIILVTYLNVDHANKTNCHILEPNIICTNRGTIDRSAFFGANATQFVFIDHTITIGHKDEFRQKPQFGNMHAVCAVGNYTCNYHYDTFNGVVGPLNVFQFIAHLAGWLATDLQGSHCVGASVIVGGDCFGYPDYMMVLLIWGIFIFIPYYTIKTIVIYRKKIYNLVA